MRTLDLAICSVIGTSLLGCVQAPGADPRLPAASAAPTSADNTLWCNSTLRDNYEEAFLECEPTLPSEPERLPEKTAWLPSFARLLFPKTQSPPFTLHVHPALPLHAGQLLVAALHPNVPCSTPLQVGWAGHSFTAYSMPNGWQHVLLPISVVTRPDHYNLSVHCGTVHSDFTLAIGAGVFAESKLQVAGKFTSEAPPRAAVEQQHINVSLHNSHTARWWHQGFVRPTAGNISSPFGVRRTFNGKLKSRHLGLDFDGRIGTPVLAANSGVVTLAANNFFYIGNAVFIDHGLQLFTMYFHLSQLRVQAGEHVVRGQLLGYLGGTGRATGPHLHFGVKLAGTYIDPADLLAYIRCYLIGFNGRL